MASQVLHAQDLLLDLSGPGATKQLLPDNCIRAIKACIRSDFGKLGLHQDLHDREFQQAVMDSVILPLKEEWESSLCDNIWARRE